MFYSELPSSNIIVNDWNIIMKHSVETCLLSTPAGIFDPYIPPEGDARLSTLSKEGLKQRTEQIRQSAASQLA